MTDHVSDEQLSLLLDGELSLASREAVMSHLRSCATCAARHDRLVELTASLRLHQPLRWSATSSERTLERLRSRGTSRPIRGRIRGGGRSWSLPFVSLVAVATVVALMLVSPGVSATVTHGPVAVFAALLPAQALLTGRFVEELAAAVVVGLLALPLSRSG